MHAVVTRFRTGLVLLLFLNVGPCFAQTARHWQYLGPGPIYIDQIVGDRNHPNLWFVVLNQNRYNHSGQLYRSSDGTQSWSHVTDLGIGEVLVHPYSSEVFLTVGESYSSRNEIWKSTDHGKTFNRIADFRFPLTSQLFFHPTNPEALFVIAGEAGPLSISNNQGASWREVTNVPVTYEECVFRKWNFHDLLVSPLAADTIYATARTSCQGNARKTLEFLLISKDRGSHWKVLEDLPRGPDSDLNTRFHYDPAFPNRAFLYGDNGLRILTQTGWMLVNSNFVLSDLVSVPGEPLHLFSSQYASLLESHDGGLSWKYSDQDLYGNIVVMQSTHHGALLAGTEMGVYELDRSKKWKPRNNGFERAKPSFFRSTLSASNDSTVFNMIRDIDISWSGFLYKQQSGKSWVNLTGKYQLDRPYAGWVQVSPTNSKHVILFDGSRASFSTDGGNTWKESSVPEHCEYGSCDIFQAPIFDPENDKVVYIVINSDVLKSTDGGATFEKLPISGKGYFARIIVDPRNSNLLFFTEQWGGTIYKSTDGGQTVERANSGLPRGTMIALTPLPSVNSYLAAAIYGNIYRTIDGGTTWTKVTRVNTYHRPDAEDICDFQSGCTVNKIWAATSEHWFVATFGSGDLYETLDAGASWKRVNDEFREGLELYEITDPKQPILYLSTSIGVFRSETQ